MSGHNTTKRAMISTATERPSSIAVWRRWVHMLAMVRSGQPGESALAIYGRALADLTPTPRDDPTVQEDTC